MSEAKIKLAGARSVTWLAAATALLAFPAAQAIDVVHVPTTEHSRPFYSAAPELEGTSHAEAEYFVSGTANVYEYNDALDLEVLSPNVAYTTRMMVRKPVSPADFNGVVIIELINPTATFDIPFLWEYLGSQVVEDGYAWVGVTVRENALAALQFWDFARYGALSLPDRGVMWEALGDIASLLKNPLDSENPLANYEVEMVLGAGYSQTDDWLTTLSNEFHESNLDVQGNPAFDGYLGVAGNAAAHAINSAASRFYDDERRYNRVNAPYFRVHTESELEIFRYPANTVRQADSDVFRQWEVAGTAHAGGPGYEWVSEIVAREWGFGFPTCDNPNFSSSIAPVTRAALHHLVAWVDDGTAPPPSQYIELNGQNDVRRDANGNALGGVRLPELEVPTGTHLPFNSGPAGTPCIFAGTFIPFPEEEIASLYRNHGNYVSRFIKAVNALEKSGYLLSRDAEIYKETAAQSEVGK